jgi:hypothetical protein
MSFNTISRYDTVTIKEIDDDYSTGNGMCPTFVEGCRIASVMDLFPDVGYQVGGSHPLGHRIVHRSVRSVIVFVERKFLQNRNTLNVIRNAIKDGRLEWGHTDHVNIQNGQGFIDLGINIEIPSIESWLHVGGLSTTGCAKFLPMD